jgi:four helix bundle protein
MFGIFASQAAPSAPSRGEEAKMPNISLMPFQRLDCYVAAKELARRVHEARITHSVLRDQACRASVSCFLQLAEGLPNDGEGMRRKYFTESNNSLQETVAALDLAQALGAVPADAAASMQELAFRLKRMLRALLHRP